MKVVPWSLKYLEDQDNFVSSNLTVLVAWCGGEEQQADIYELQTEADLSHCENFPEVPLTVSSTNDVNGFIVTGPGARYFASKKCEEGFKVKIEII